MKNNQRLYYFSGAAAVVLAASIYVLQSPHPVALDAGSRDGRSGESEQSRATGFEAAGAARDKQYGKNRPYVDPETSSLIEDVDPAEYSSNPSKQDYEKEILALANRLDMTEMQKAQAILSKFHTLPPEGQVLAMDHATQLIPDDNYLQMRPTLLRLSTTPELRETVLTDVLSRKEKVRMPTLVELLRQRPNEEQEEVKDILVAYLDVSPDDDLTKIDAAVRKFLIENPED